MFEYATYNGVPIITYGLIGLTTGILALVTLNPNILELKEKKILSFSRKNIFFKLRNFSKNMVL